MQGYPGSTPLVDSPKEQEHEAEQQETATESAAQLARLKQKAAPQDEAMRTIIRSGSGRPIQNGSGGYVEGTTPEERKYMNRDRGGDDHSNSAGQQNAGGNQVNNGGGTNTGGGSF